MGRRKVVWRHKKALQELLCEAEILAYKAYKAQRDGDEKTCMEIFCQREKLIGDFFDRYEIDPASMQKICDTNCAGWKRAYTPQ